MGKSTCHFQLFEEPQVIEVVEGVGSHGGGDIEMLKDIFSDKTDDRFKRATNHIQGAMSILTGIAANISLKTGMPVNVSDLVKFE